MRSRTAAFVAGGETITFYQGSGECDFVIGEEEHVKRLVQVTWSMAGDDTAVKKTRKREIDGLVEAAEELRCEDLTIVTHDESATLSERGHTIRIVPAWKYLLR